MILQLGVHIELVLSWKGENSMLGNGLTEEINLCYLLLGLGGWGGERGIKWAAVE